MSNRFDILHIKRHTEGTSNELSFDVLDAASNELDGKSRGFFGRRKGKKSPDTVKPPKSQQDDGKAAGSPAASMPAVPAAPPVSETVSHPNLSPADEISQRKKKRRADTRRTKLLVAVVVLALLAGLVLFFYQNYQQRQDYATQFTRLVNEFVDADQTLVTVDDLMANPMAPESAELRDQMQGRFDTIRTTLQRVQAGARSLESMAADERDKAALGKVVEAAVGRTAMVDGADKAFDLVREALANIDEADGIWEAVMEADSKARDAAHAANSAKDEGSTSAARDATEEAKGMFEDALYRLRMLQDNVGEELDLSAQIAYLEKRVEALEYAIDTADALIDGNRSEATANNDAYNRAEQEAARMAEALPLALSDPVRAYYEQRLQPLSEDYEKARQDVSATDAIIRDYLGERGK